MILCYVVIIVIIRLLSSISLYAWARVSGKVKAEMSLEVPGRSHVPHTDLGAALGAARDASHREIPGAGAHVARGPSAGCHVAEGARCSERLKCRQRKMRERPSNERTEGNEDHWIGRKWAC